MKNNRKLHSIALALAALILFLVLFSTAASAATVQSGEGQLTSKEVQINNIQSETSTQISTSSQNINKVYGISFSPYMDGQNPNYGSQINKKQITERMKIIAPYTKWIRTYGTENGLEYAGPVAHEMGIKTAIGAWLGTDDTVNKQQINELIDEAKAGDVDLAIVGSETLLRNDLSEDQLINYIKLVKKKAPGVNVTTADTYSELLNHPKVMEECDVIMYNSYPYWEGISIDNAITVQDSHYKSLANKVKNKPIFVSETGWPSAGNKIGNAVPSYKNSAKYFNDFVLWARKNNIQFFYFEAFDETWKSDNEGPQGAHWGIWDKNGNMKSGMEKVFLIPHANFLASPTSGTMPLKVQFTDKSTNSPASWIWSFGDGTSSTSKNPAHTYTKAGKYTVKLTVKNAAGSSTKTVTNYITIKAALVKPVAAFSASPTTGKAPLKVTFTDKSINSPTSWIWSFGDGTTSTTKSPAHKYTKVGKYTVKLTVKNSAGSSAITKTSYIKVT